MSVLTQAVFWAGLAILGYTYVGYRWLIGLLATLRPRLVSGASSATRAEPPRVLVVIVARNEADRITARIQNLLASDYPESHLVVLVVSDGSEDATAERVRQFGSQRVSLIEQQVRSGKAAGLNQALASPEAGRADVIVFTDARQSFAANTISVLLEALADDQVGAASGYLQIQSASSGIGSSVDTYWRYETGLRTAEARFDSCIGCTGAVYAIRRNLYRPIPGDTLLDDVLIPMQVAIAGFRVLYCPEAVAYDPQPLEPETEKSRKRRTLAGNFQLLFRYPEWLLPWRNRLWWQLLSHKYLRLAAPFLLIAVGLANLLLATHPIYLGLLALQLFFYLLAGLGLMFPRLKMRCFSLPAGFLFLNVTVVRALRHFLCGEDQHLWRGKAN